MEYRYRPPEPNRDLWWQIALGVFIALMAHSVVVGAYTSYVLKRELRALEAQTIQQQKAIARQAEAAAAAAFHPQYSSASSARPSPRARPLAEGERCIQGRRFQRVENGWVQLPREPC